MRLRHIREKLLKKHEDMGIVRDNCDEYFANMTHEEVVSRLKELNIPFNESHDLRQKLRDACRTRYLKVWHDHSSIANHGYLLVLVSFIYDTAFYYTTQEMKDLKGISIDVPAFVQIPEVHIIARSSSSTQDQLLFIDVRKECIEEMSDTLKTTAGVEVHDIVRFFYGDGPAAQFEAGQKQGGSYCCVGCGAHSGRFSDIAFSYRAPKQSLQERQKFVLQGRAWRKGGEQPTYMCMYNVHVKIQCMYKATIKGLYVYTCAGINPMDNLKISELRIELERRGLSTARKRKPELERDFDELRRGIVNVPALLQGSPDTPLTNLHLDRYEISLVEPLHDVKGHLSNLIDEAILTGEAKERVDAIANSVLGKETLRGSDFRKGAILMLKALQDILPNSFVTTTLSTAVEMLYSRPHKRTQQSMLRLHNLSFVHAKLCSDHLSNPKKMSQRKMFGRYFHAHSPLLYRIITPRLLNTEVEERVFGQCKAITRSTSNQHTSNIITNLLVRMHYEQK